MPSLGELLPQLEKSPKYNISAKYGKAAGCFADALTPASRENLSILSESEAFVRDFIREQVARNGKARAIELGGICALSFYKIAATMSDKIREGNIQFFSTNAEVDFNINKVLEEAERRLSIFPSFFQWEGVWRDLQHYPNLNLEAQTKFMILVDRYRPILTKEEVEFIRNNSDLVSHIAGIDTTSLPTLVSDYPADIIHEVNGGLYHHPDLVAATHAVLSSVNRSHGRVMTTMDLPHEVMNRYNFQERTGYNYHIWSPRE